MRPWQVCVWLLPAALGISLRGNSSQQDARDPRVYFLFLATDKISNLDVWTAFFDSADSDKYRAFVHCKEKSCVQQMAGSPIIPVPTVASYYCTDLVSPMNQLLSYALSTDLGPVNARDKFAFISDSALPAKPFAEVHRILGERDGSDFCVFPPGEWADMPSDGDLEVAVKVHQWVTLSRDHAEHASAMWQRGVMHNFMSYFKMNQLGWNNVLDNNFADNRNWGCLDEFWYLTALYGTLKKVRRDGDQSIELPGFTGSPLRIDKNAGWQGKCDTFVIWAKYMHSLGRNEQQNLMLSLDPPSVPHGGNWARPGWWDTISTKGIHAIRNSDFLFVRKFIDKPTLHDGDNFAAAYSKIVVQDIPPSSLA
ncbi:unnamed protein product [Effrenium voratum]|uniref:Uncharacterized protein n=1 Tax=Effrenium voratum TaxID=2562239 RepID=A0AA36NBJ4_9DINO|nr:unnamed protein product [Effrenium voratum]CAJ1406280.1 unnamed protein product [Effrenium voratum]CAJ1429906.1 unnamed protein product [Effrenium voratum]|mmetsp:Transcript_4481/g.10777  ORF Transcript_4481/g.10777 Transcript_4481/m.10777 type:complete len:366 (+) Transcript_4481:68-1165(+)